MVPMISRTVAPAQRSPARLTVAALLLAGAGSKRRHCGRSAAAATVGEARAGTLTVALPAAVSDRIYALPSAAGRPIVVIDPGHGGRDPGATSVSGQVHEKDLTLALARELRDTLVERGPGARRDDSRRRPLSDAR